MAEPVLDIRDLRKTFGALKATDGVSLDLRPGEIHALIGPNGAGKSTLIHQIAGTLKPDAGEVRFLGQTVNQLGVAERARMGLGRSFQVSSLATEFSALRNVMLAVQSKQGSSFRFFKPVMRDKSLTEPAMAALERVGLKDRAHVPAAELSHGERRQLEIAIALALDSKAFLLDEPMAGMGPEGSRQLTGFLDGLRHEAPILLVEHDMDAVFALADRISVLVYGRIIASGSVDDIRNNPEVRRAYLGDME
ncbi:MULTISPECIES: ABC transporter ATP-binding protein [unclassified Aminobacter]|uniref:ABC transporter ATP-binding protein n=1 Tax=unclassified Aminobacter TaxID=2644704 RepID=UPI0004657A54|nr:MULTISPECIES: ABC transporter ATP-binding protein [unclassified Aminobacter]TWG65568.1 branched-chain amino acid transport system ATP-binding protein [Aminobacter sp. J44]TWH36278.1 branched-chain amino acid transport system ATP-binding protein [Aminobacter sp. J15]